MSNIWKKLAAVVLCLALVCGAALAEEETLEDVTAAEMAEADGFEEEEFAEEEDLFGGFADDYSMDVVYEWPDTLDGIPVFEAESYESWIATDSVEVFLPAGAAEDFDAYVKQLSDMGASVHVNNDLLIVLALGDIEIHMLPDEDQPSIAFLGEPAYDYEEDMALYPELENYPMPEGGRIVALEGSYDYGYEGEEERETLESIIVIDRCASISDAIDYCEKLTLAGWVPQETVKPVDNTLFGVYVRAGRMIMIDYYTNGSDFMIYFGMFE